MKGKQLFASCLLLLLLAGCPFSVHDETTGVPPDLESRYPPQLYYIGVVCGKNEQTLQKEVREKTAAQLGDLVLRQWKNLVAQMRKHASAAILAQLEANRPSCCRGWFDDLTKLPRNARWHSKKGYCMMGILEKALVETRMLKVWSEKREKFRTDYQLARYNKHRLPKFTQAFRRAIYSFPSTFAIGALLFGTRVSFDPDWVGIRKEIRDLMSLAEQVTKTDVFCKAGAGIPAELRSTAINPLVQALKRLGLPNARSGDCTSSPGVTVTMKWDSQCSGTTCLVGVSLEFSMCHEKETFARCSLTPEPVPASSGEELALNFSGLLLDENGELWKALTSCIKYIFPVSGPGG